MVWMLDELALSRISVSSTLSCQRIFSSLLRQVMWKWFNSWREVGTLSMLHSHRVVWAARQLCRPSVSCLCWCPYVSTLESWVYQRRHWLWQYEYQLRRQWLHSETKYWWGNPLLVTLIQHLTLCKYYMSTCVFTVCKVIQYFLITGTITHIP
jgi:hypothetical protein